MYKYSGHTGKDSSSLRRFLYKVKGTGNTKIWLSPIFVEWVWSDSWLEQNHHILYLQLLEILLEKKANCLLKDRAGIIPLHTAAKFGKDRHVEALAKASFACVDQKDSEGRTPLHFAALNGKGWGLVRSWTYPSTGAYHNLVHENPLDEWRSL